MLNSTPPVPVTVKERDRLTGEQTDERRVFFKATFVFDVSQTDVPDGAQPVALGPPREPLTGDSHAHLLAPLQRFAESLGYSGRVASSSTVTSRGRLPRTGMRDHVVNERC